MSVASDRPVEGALQDRLAALTPDQRAALEQKLGLHPLVTAAVSVDPGAASLRHLPFPLTDIQQAYWAGRTADFASGAVATHAYTEISGVNLDLDLLADAWNRLVARHDMLRAVFLPDGLQQVLAQVPPYAIAVEDLRELSPDQATVQLARQRQAMSHQVFDTERWPLFDIRATLLAGRRVCVHLSFDAIVADISSRRSLMREWGQLYRDSGAELPPAEAKFRDFVIAEQVGRSSPQYRRARDYWLARVDTLPSAPAPPLRDDPELHAPPVFIRRTLRLGAEQCAQLERRAKDFGVSLNVLLLTAYADVLRLWSRADAFTLNLTLFNRPPGGAMAPVVGDFTSLSLLEVDAPADDGLGERLRRLQSRLWRDLDHRQFSGVAVVREIVRRQGGFDGPVMPFVFTSAPAPLSGGGHDLAWMGDEVYAASQTPQVWVDLMVVPQADELAIHWNSVDARFPPGLMAEMFSALGRWLDHLARGELDQASVWRRIAEILLPDEDRRVQRAANATAGPAPQRLLHQMWRAHARTKPERPAVISAARTLSYGQLENMTANLGSRLRGLGVKPGALVAVVMTKGWEQVVAVLAVLESGGAYLPIDPAEPAARLRHLITDANAGIVLTQAALVESLAWPDGVLTVTVVGDEALQASASDLEPAQAMSDLAYVIYTSGSAGLPKGVEIDHLGAANTIEDINERFAVGPGDRVLALSALTFDLSVYDIFGVLGAGGAVVMPEPAVARDPAQWADLICRHGVTIWNTVPALMELLADYAAAKGISFPQLRLALLSGDRIPITLPPAVRRIAPQARTVSLGGATEASIWSIWHDIGEPAATASTIPYGAPLRNQTFRVLSPELAARPTWAAGDLYIGGMGLARGYRGDVAKTAAAFVVDRESGERLYRTGDRGRYLPDGSIEFLGRDDTQVKLRGFRIELGEIEAILAGHPAVKDAVVVATQNDSVERTLVAYIVPNILSEPTPAQLARYLREQLPGHMVPARIVLLPALPLTANGKVDRRALAVRPLSRPDGSDVSTPQPYTEEIGALVRRVSRVEIPTTDSSLLDLGLTSVDLIRIVNAIDAEFGFRPEVEPLYTSPTIRWLAARYADWREAGGRSLADSIRARREPHVDIGPVVALPQADTALGELRQRRTVRRFALRQIEQEHLGSLLGALRSDDGRRRYGSASGLYPVDVYLYAKQGRIAGLSPGPHLYDPATHGLRPIRPGGRLSRLAFSRAQNAAIFDEAAFALLLVARMGAIEPTYGDRALRLATLEGGMITQTLELLAPARGLGLCQIGSVDEAVARELLGLSDDQQLLHAILGGYPDGSSLAAASPDGAEGTRLERMIERVEQLTSDEAQALLAAYADALG